MKKIMLLGSGELGKELVIAAQRIGLYTIACDRYNNAPAMQVADEREVFDMLDGQALDAAVERHRPDLIFAEIEAIRTERLLTYEQRGMKVVPSAKAVNFTMNRKAIRDLAAKELGIRTAKYFYAKTFDELQKAADEIGYPCVVKPLMSSSGHGQSIVRTSSELLQAFHEALEGSRGDVKNLSLKSLYNLMQSLLCSQLHKKMEKLCFVHPSDTFKKEETIKRVGSLLPFLMLQYSRHKRWQRK